jgi:hypothetical protein
MGKALAITYIVGEEKGKINSFRAAIGNCPACR